MSTRRSTAAAGVIAALATAVTVTACTTGPAPEPSTAPVSTSIAMTPVLPDLSWLSNKVDITAAQAALHARVPFAFSVADGAGTVCHTGVIDPNGELWFLDRAPVPVEGAALNHAGKLMPCAASGVSTTAPSAARTDGVPDLSWLSSEVNVTAAGAAMKSGKPFAFGIPDGPQTACHSGLLLPDGVVWVMNKSGAAPASGVALEKEMNAYGCSAVRLPGGEGN